MVEGSTLFLGAIVFLMYTAGHLLLDQPGIVVIFLLVVILNLAVAGLLGLWLRSCNLAVRFRGEEGGCWGCGCAHVTFPTITMP